MCQVQFEIFSNIMSSVNVILNCLHELSYQLLNMTEKITNMHIIFNFAAMQMKNYP